MARASLLPGERALFGAVARAVTINPFSGERRDLDLELAGEDVGEGALAAVLARLADALAALARDGRTDPRSFGAEDRALLERARLFDVYYRARTLFDEHIAEQLEAGDEPLPVSFATSVLAELSELGFPRDVALRHFALFFQLRRAFHFVDRSLVGASRSMVALRASLWDAVFTRDLELYERHLRGRMDDFSTLLLGETGSGKGAAAAAIGYSGHIPFDRVTGRFAESFTRAFVPLNLASVPESLIESALFGHRKGAFTGAIDHGDGVLALCSPHGSIFLDEIGEVAEPVQVKLLEVLQTRTFTPVGGRTKQRFRGRVIAATNRSLDDLRGRGRLRDDFYYRLCSDVIVVPSLRERLAEDSGELARLVSVAVGRILADSAPDLDRFALEALERDVPRGYPWPGNVRELEQAVRRVLLRGSYSPEARRTSSSDARALAAELESGNLDARELLARYCALLHARLRTVEEVARRTGLDRRTVRKYLDRTRPPGARSERTRSPAT